VIKVWAITAIFLAGIFSIACVSETEPKPKPEFIELRLHRWTALEGGETLVMRQIGGKWSAMLIGDDARFSCLYQRSVRPKSEWNQLWNTLLSKGLTEIDDLQQNLMVEDGDGFNVEITYQGTLKRYSIPQPEFQTSPSAKQILDISDLISREFDTPVFVADYDRGKVGEYLIFNCKELRK